MLPKSNYFSAQSSLSNAKRPSYQVWASLVRHLIDTLQVMRQMIKLPSLQHWSFLLMFVYVVPRLSCSSQSGLCLQAKSLGSATANIEKQQKAN